MQLKFNFTNLDKILLQANNDSINVSINFNSFYCAFFSKINFLEIEDSKIISLLFSLNIFSKNLNLFNKHLLFLSINKLNQIDRKNIDQFFNLLKKDKLDLLVKREVISYLKIDTFFIYGYKILDTFYILLIKNEEIN